MTDIVYVLRDGENYELRYSLRSLCNLPRVGRVWLSGGSPDWVQNVERITLPQTGSKYTNSGMNLRAAVEHPDVADEFILFNDDFFVTSRLERVPVLNRGPLEQILSWYEYRYPDAPENPHPYTRGMRHTLDMLTQLGVAQPLSYELHVPMLINKQRALEINVQIRAMLASGAISRPLHWRTIYGNLAGIGGATVPDVKVYSRQDPILFPFTSTNDGVFKRGRAGREIRELFLDPSHFEAFPLSPRARHLLRVPSTAALG